MVISSFLFGDAKHSASVCFFMLRYTTKLAGFFDCRAWGQVRGGEISGSGYGRRYFQLLKKTLYSKEAPFSVRQDMNFSFEACDLYFMSVQCFSSSLREPGEDRDPMPAFTACFTASVD
jgi:hypothetical protein